MTNEAGEKPESIRQWYDRTTRKWRKGLWVATTIVLALMGIAYKLLDTPTLARLQTFNGALTIPLFGGLWIVSFIFMFLVPSREASFRGQESLDATANLLAKTISENVIPAMQKLKLLASRLEAEVSTGLIAEIREAVGTLKGTAGVVNGTAAKLEASATVSSDELKKTSAELKKFGEDVRPAVDALKRIQARMENAINKGLLENIETAMDSVQRLSGVPPMPATSVKAPVAAGIPAKPTFEPDLDMALKMVSKRPAPASKVPASAPAALLAVQEPLLPAGPNPPGPLPLTQKPLQIEKMQAI